VKPALTKMMKDYATEMGHRAEIEYRIGDGHQYLGIKPRFTQMKNGDVEIDFYNTKYIRIARHRISDDEYRSLPQGKKGTEYLIEKFDLA